MVERIRRKFQSLEPVLDVPSRRQWAAAAAGELGYSGVSAVARATGLARDTIRVGLRELEHRREHPDDPPGPRVRQPGGGRKAVTATDPALATALEALVEPHPRGDPQSPLRWTCKSTRQLAAALTRQGHPVGYRTVGRLLGEAGYSLQANRKTREGSRHPDRNAQFEFLNAQAERFQRGPQPVILIDTKKSCRSRAWKVAVQGLADELGLTLVCHFPPGTSKWNKVEHRLFCHMTNNWRGQPLVSHQVIVNLIAATTTAKGLTVQRPQTRTSTRPG